MPLLPNLIPSSALNSILPISLTDLIKYLERPISQSFDYLFLDATYIPCLDNIKVDKAALLVTLGISEDSSISVLGFLLGDKESLDDLIKRGLNVSNIKLVISDEHHPIISAVKQKINKPHQLCVVHKIKNSLCRVKNKQHKKEFSADLKAIFFANSKNKALISAGNLKAKWLIWSPKNEHPVAQIFLYLQTQTVLVTSQV